MTEKDNILHFPGKGNEPLGAEPEQEPTPMSKSSGTGDGDGTNERLVRLETHFGYIQRDLAEIKSALNNVGNRLNELPTKSELNSWRWQWGFMALAVIALTVASIVGGLALINRSVDNRPAAPIIIQVPEQHVKQP